MSEMVAGGSEGLTGETFQGNGAVCRPQDLTALESVILDRLARATKWDPVSRRELVFLTGTRDRTVRECIASMRRKGVRVASSSSRYGYWLCRSEGEYKVLRNEYLSRIDTLSKTLKAMDSVVGGQVSWDLDTY